MKKTLTFLAISAIACNGVKHSDTNADIKDTDNEYSAQIKKYYLNQPAEKMFKLDSIEIFAVDTIDARADSQRVFRRAKNAFNELTDELVEREEAMKNDLYHMRLISNYSSPTYRKYQRDYNANNLKVERLMKLSGKELAHMKHLSLLMVNKKIDSVAKTGYLVSFNAKGYTKANAPISLDSVILPFNKSKQLIAD